MRDPLTIKQRVALARRALIEHDQHPERAGTALECVVDLLADLIHYCATSKVDFDEAVGMAVLYAEAESQEADDEL